ncbi:MAG: glycosyltransferase [Promethearchaeota archaeon]
MKQIKCLHVSSSFQVGGIECWLVSISKHLRCRNVLMDVMVGRSGPEPLAEKFLRYGNRVHYCGSITKPWRYAWKYIRILKNYGPYDVVHCHTGALSWFVLAIAWLFGIRVRISNSHSEYYNLDSFSKRIQRSIFSKLIRLFSTCRIATSKSAGKSLFGNNWGDGVYEKVFYLGIDLERFSALTETPVSKSSLAIPNDAYVVGHVGGFRPVKNHRFIIEIAVELLKVNPDTRFLLLGGGSLENEIRQIATERGVISNIVFTGVVSDVPAYLDVMDCFILPSIYEGLPLSLLEAQAAGIPSIISDVITSEADIIEDLIVRVSTMQKASIWAKAIVETFRKGRIEREEALRYFIGSPMDISVSTQTLLKLYLSHHR